MTDLQRMLTMCQIDLKIPLPPEGTFKALIFDTSGATGVPVVRDFDTEAGFKGLALDQAFTQPLHSGGQTALKAFVFNDQGACVEQFGSL